MHVLEKRMVSAVARPYIDASVAVLREHGLAITRTFYQNMFAAHPELTNLFNMGNQASGVQQQSLASAVFAYAANIDNAAALQYRRSCQQIASRGLWAGVAKLSELRTSSSTASCIMQDV
jgi:hemoglobin-like flavoprotein